MAGNTQGSIGFESKLWDAADLLRNNMDPSEYKHVVLGLIFLKYISDSFVARQAELTSWVSDPENEDYYWPDEATRGEELNSILTDRDEYTCVNVFWVPENARWEYLQNNAAQEIIGQLIDDAMFQIEGENPPLKGALPKVYGKPDLDKTKLGQLVNVLSGIELIANNTSKDILGRVYEYFLNRFASKEGRGGGEFYTPEIVVRLLVEMLEPYKGRVYDPCCGSGGMFVQSYKFIEAHNGKRNQITVYGQESNYTTWRLARMNMAIRGIEAKLGKEAADTFHKDLHPDLRADFIMANPPFNISAWGADRTQDDVRWKYGNPPDGNANYAWIQHMVHHLAPNGTAGFVLANGSMSTMTSGEGAIRQKLVEEDLVDCIVALPSNLFYSTTIPVCLWFISKNKVGAKRGEQRGKVLFINAGNMGHLEDRTHRTFTDEELNKISQTYHSWKANDGKYEDVLGFCKSADIEEMKEHAFVLTPGRYVGAEEVEDDGEPFEEKMERLVSTLSQQMKQSVTLDGKLHDALGGIGYGW